MHRDNERFEALLLSHVPLCFKVALQLTRNRKHARAITTKVMERALKLHDNSEVRRTLKPRLLAWVRILFTQQRDERARREFQTRNMSPLPIPGVGLRAGT
ncbi:MAG TPA: hypothetical protein PLJ47_05050 [Candidatus Hydrogenedentes bacterium]|nr:hypothetical protein [Candidatus Hydrogenedentota bacterium]HRK33945.1 hypothetical protein [Candidatus Hydrogenedentota bacterium]